MRGIDAARQWYETAGAPMLEREFGGVVSRIAVGRAGHGSECFGYDDEVSQDHDFEPCFCLFLPEEELVSRRSAFLLERAYAKLPDSFQGFTREKMRWVNGAQFMDHPYVAMRTPRGSFIGIAEGMRFEVNFVVEANDGEYAAYPSWDIEHHAFGEAYEAEKIR